MRQVLETFHTNKYAYRKTVEKPLHYLERFNYVTHEWDEIDNQTIYQYLQRWALRHEDEMRMAKDYDPKNSEE